MGEQFSKMDFKNNLLKTVEKILLNMGLTVNNNIKFSIKANLEPNKKHTSIDDLMRLWPLSEKNTQNRYFDVDKAITLIVFSDQKYPSKFPLWVNVSYQGVIDSCYIFLLEVSLRYRSQSLMHNKETGHPPFKAIFP